MAETHSVRHLFEFGQVNKANSFTALAVPVARDLRSYVSVLNASLGER